MADMESTRPDATSSNTLAVGIDSMSFDTSRYYLPLKDLAQARGEDADKYESSYGQKHMAVSPPGEDVVTLGANAARRAINGIDTSDIHLLMFATESGIDQSKAAGVFVHELLGLPRSCKVVELKQACYSATFGLHMAMTHIRANPQHKILLIASDIARYGLKTGGESSQGAGAVAMVLSANPRLVAIESGSGYRTEDAMDFWRPNYRDEALVEGKLSCELYLKLLKETFAAYTETTGRTYEDHDYFCYHTPLPKLAQSAHLKLAMVNGQRKVDRALLEQKMGQSLAYTGLVGNTYSASLYLGLISLLENTNADFAGKRVGFYSYGSGAVAEFFSGVVQPGYQDVLHTQVHHALIESRQAVSMPTYEALYSFKLPTNGSEFELPHHPTGHYPLSHLHAHQRVYVSLDAPISAHPESHTTKTADTRP